MIVPFQDKQPVLHPTVYIAPGACVIGDVEIGEDSSLWFNSVLRGDVHFIRIGRRTNIQDNCTVHVTTQIFPTLLGDRVTVGHNVVIHGATIQNDVLIGMGSIVLDDAEIGEGSFVAAGSLVTPGTKIPPGSFVRGFPAKVLRPVSDRERQWIEEGALNYAELAQHYKRQEKT